MPTARSRFLLALGAAYAGAGTMLLAVVARSVAPGLSTASGGVLAATAALCLALVAAIVWGVHTVVERHEPKTFFWNLLLLLYLALTPLLGEALLRVGIATGASAFRNPRLYADRLAESDYFKLVDLWLPPRKPAPVTGLPRIAHDPLLGWSFPRSDDNPLGVYARLPFSADPTLRPVLFYGDSFTLHGEPVEAKIPQALDALLVDAQVHNYGVGGYGLDQIYLRFRQSHPLFERPIVLFGLLTTDIDRCLLDYRHAPKPRFAIAGDGLELVPAAPEDDDYLANNPPRIGSYFLTAARRLLSYVLAGGGADGLHRREEKEELASRLLDLVAAEAREHELDLVFVLFSTLRETDWRRDFLLGEFRRLGAAYFDAQESLMAAEAREGRQRRESFDETGHHTPWANRVLAEALRDYLVSTGRATAAESAP